MRHSVVTKQFYRMALFLFQTLNLYGFGAFLCPAQGLTALFFISVTPKKLKIKRRIF